MCIGSRGKGNLFLHRELNQLVTRIKFVDRFPPTGGGKFNRQIACANKVESFVRDRLYLRIRSVTVDFDQIEVRQAIDQPG